MLKNKKCLILLSILCVCLVLVLVAICIFHKCDNYANKSDDEETITIDLNDQIRNSYNPSLTVYYTDDFLISTRSPVPAEELVYGADCKHRFDLFDLNEYTEHIEKFGETNFECVSDDDCYMDARVHYVIEDSKTGKRTEITLGMSGVVLVNGNFITLDKEPRAESLYQFIVPFLLEGNAGRQIAELYQ